MFPEVIWGLKKKKKRTAPDLRMYLGNEKLDSGVGYPAVFSLEVFIVIGPDPDGGYEVK